MSVLTLLSPSEIRERQRFLYKENREYPAQLVEIPQERWPVAPRVFKSEVIQVWRSRDFLVQIHREGEHIRITVNRTLMDRDGNYAEGISWDDLQRVKRECGYGQFDAVEIYPRDVDVVNVSNMRHLWILNPGDNLGVIWRAK